MFIAIVFVSFGLFVWNGQLYSDYLTNLRSREDRFDQMSSELISITDFRFDLNKINLTVTNNGTNTARIVRVWVYNLSAPSAWTKSYSVNILITPSRSVKNIGQRQGADFGNGYTPSNLYVVKLVTEHGNIFSAVNYHRQTIVGIAQGMGWISLDWDSYMFNDINNLNLRPGWNVSKSGVGNVVQFQIGIINHWDRNLTLLKYTYLKMDKSTTVGSTMNFYMMDSNSQPNNILCYDPVAHPIVVPPSSTGDSETGGNVTTLKFLGSGYAKNQCGSNQALQTDRFQVYLVLYYQYTLSSKTYVVAQTIPFEGTAIIS
jgi:hypothetical protein